MAEIGVNKEKQRIYVCIDLKSFYASVECMERGLDPMKTNLVVADSSRTEKTICLAVTPSLKAYGISGRARLFEVVQKVREVNSYRRQKAPNHTFSGSSCNADELSADSSLSLDYIAAPPQMALYIQYSTRIYDIYLKYVAPEDMHVYSIDEVFMDITDYLAMHKLTPREFTKMIIKDVIETTGITAAAGIGTNLYLAKIAMDIGGKKIQADKDGVRIAELDEISYRKLLWTHRPITDFWRVGAGYAKKLEAHGMYTMGDVARCSVGKPYEIHNEELLYKLFGVNAELLIDHAWGYEPCTISQIKAYRPESSSLGSGQVLHCPYSFEKARLIVKEMTELLVLDLVEKGLVTDQIVLTVGYDIDNLKGSAAKNYKGEITVDHYGRKVPKHAHGSENLGKYTSSTALISDAVLRLFDRIVDDTLLVRRVNLVANHILYEKDVENQVVYEQLDLFTDYDAEDKRREAQNDALEREKNMQKALICIKKKYGKNAVIKGMNLQEGATSIDRNNQIGGHKA